MFIRASTIVFTVAAITGLVSAVPTDLEARGGSSTCNSGSIHCCNSVQESSNPFVGGYFDYFGIPPPSSGTQVGFTCSPVSVGGSGSGAFCTQQTVCCEGNSFNGAVVTGCSPVTINA